MTRISFRNTRIREYASPSPAPHAYFPGVDPNRPGDILILRRRPGERYFSKLQSFPEHAHIGHIHLALDGWRKLFGSDESLMVATTGEYLREPSAPLPYNPRTQRILLSDL